MQPTALVSGQASGLCIAVPLMDIRAPGRVLDSISPDRNSIEATSAQPSPVLSDDYGAQYEGRVSALLYARRSAEVGGWLLPHGCAIGFTGPMCTECEDGYAMGDKDCLPCSNSSGIVWLQAVMLIGLVCVCAIVTHRTLAENVAVTAKSILQQILFNHLQMLGLLRYIQLEWPSVVGNVMAFFGAMTGSRTTVASLACVLPPTVPVSVFATAAALTAPVISMLAWLGLNTVTRHIGKQRGQRGQLATQNREAAWQNTNDPPRALAPAKRFTFQWGQQAVSSSCAAIFKLPESLRKIRPPSCLPLCCSALDRLPALPLHHSHPAGTSPLCLPLRRRAVHLIQSSDASHGRFHRHG